MRTRQKSAEAIVAQIAVETRQERRAEEAGKCDQPDDSDQTGEKNSETTWAWQLRPPPVTAQQWARDGCPGLGVRGERVRGWAKNGSKTMHKAEPMEAVTLESVLEKENLKAAWQQVKANGGAAGVDGRDVEQSCDYIRAQWADIEQALLNGRYTPGAVRAVQIPKANGGVRTLGIPTVLDRLIQQAIHQRLSPQWEPGLSEHSYGFRPGRSAHEAVRAGQRYVKAGKSWVIDIDLKSFFDRVGHDKLMHLVGQKVRDKGLLRLIGDYLRAPMLWPDGRQELRRQGTPQGGPLSPLLANIYLDPLDQELEKRGLSFVRYADDIAIFVSSERSAERVKGSVVAWIEKHLKLEVNREKTGSGPSDQQRTAGLPTVPRRTHRRDTQNGGTAAHESPATVGRSTERHEQPTAHAVAALHPRMVELLRPRRLATRGGGPIRMDTTPHAKVLLVALENATRSPQCAQAPWGPRASAGTSL